MKVIFTALLLLLLVETTAAQVENRLSIGLHFQQDNPFGATQGKYWTGGWNCATPLAIYEQPFLFTGGVQLNYGLTKNFEFSTGVQFSRQEQNYDFYYGCFYPCVAMPFAPNYSNNHLEVPIKMRFYMLPGNFKMHVDAGQKVGIQLQSNYWSSRFSYGVVGGFGFDYFIDRFQLSLSANYGRAIRTDRHYNPYSKNNLGFELKTSFQVN